MNKEKHYSLTQTCKRLKEKPHMLRYWEQQFGLRIRRNSAGRRIYSETQIERLATIRRLLHEEKLTIDGARRRLLHSGRTDQTAQSLPRADTGWLEEELRSIRTLLNV